MLGGCDAGDPELQPLDAPPVRLLSVSGTTGLDDLGRPVRETLNPDGSSVLLSTTSLVLRFDRYIDARDAIRQSVCLRSSTDPVPDPLACEGSLFLRPSYDPVRRELTFFQQDGQPRLEPDTLYQLTIYSPVAEDSFGVRAFDGAPLAEGAVVRFRTSADTTVTEVEQLAPTSTYCADDEECLATCAGDACANCLRSARGVLRACSPANGGCHEAQQGSEAPMGLNLTAPEFIAATALGHVAHQTQTGGNADVPVQGSPRFGSSMPIIDPQNAGNSYLLYKVLADEKLAATLPDLLPGETERLRSGFVVGQPMPAPTHLGSAAVDPIALTAAEASALSLWIAAGAPMDCAF